MADVPVICYSQALDRFLLRVNGQDLEQTFETIEGARAWSLLHLNEDPLAYLEELMDQAEQEGDGG